MLEEVLMSAKELRVRQRKELAEIFGFETRNKYEIRSETDAVVGFAAEQHKGLLAFFSRYLLGHWRRFEVLVFNASRVPVLKLVHPFRWIFQRIEVATADGKHFGALQQRFAILRKRFDIEDARGNVIFQVDSPIWKPWTFPIEKNGTQIALVKKRWSGLLKESFLDADNFTVSFESSSLSKEERLLVLASALFVDIQYFERKAKS